MITSGPGEYTLCALSCRNSWNTSSVSTDSNALIRTSVMCTVGGDKVYTGSAVHAHTTGLIAYHTLPLTLYGCVNRKTAQE